jgi:hypothetical protein
MSIAHPKTSCRSSTRTRSSRQDSQGRQFGLLQPAQTDNSINHAVVYLGFNTIKNLALSIAAIGMLPKDNAAGFDGRTVPAAFAGHRWHRQGIWPAGWRMPTRWTVLSPACCTTLAKWCLPSSCRRISSGAGVQQEDGTSLHLALREVNRYGPCRRGCHAGGKMALRAPLVETIRHQFGDRPDRHRHDRLRVWSQPDQQETANFGFGGNPFDRRSCHLPWRRRLGGSLDEVIASSQAT